MKTESQDRVNPDTTTEPTLTSYPVELILEMSEKVDAQAAAKDFRSEKRAIVSDPGDEMDPIWG